jgi:hypothetical protein
LSVRARKLNDLNHSKCPNRPSQVKPGGGRTLGEPNGIKAVSVFLDAGAGLEDAVPMDEAEEDSRATPLWYAVARGENLPLVRFLLD